MSHVVPFGAHEGRLLSEVAASGDWTTLLWLLGLVRFRVRHPSAYREAMALYGEHCASGGAMPDVWIDAYGRTRFITSDSRSNLEVLPLYPLCDRALVYMLERAGGNLQRSELVARTLARLPSPRVSQAKRREMLGRAVKRLQKRGVLELRGEAVTRTALKVSYKCADFAPEDGADLV